MMHGPASYTAYRPVILVAIGLIVGPPRFADAATKKVQVPDRYDGSWGITVVTNEGPCSPSTTYHLQIKDNDASVPGDEVDIDGSVTTGGGVAATITKGSVKVPITGSLDTNGTGSGTWRTMGGLVECTGNWTAKRAR